jgi:hypothetical protein
MRARMEAVVDVFWLAVWKWRRAKASFVSMLLQLK